MELAERTDFLFALNNDFNLGTFTLMLSEKLNRKLENEIVPTGLSYPQILEIVVQKAIQEGWIFGLLDGALAANPTGLNLKNFVARYPDLDPAKGPPPAIDYVMAHTLRARRFFIDRKDLRAALKELRSPDGSRVLVVTGDRVSGKSYTSELINFLSDRTPNHKAIFADLDRYLFDSLRLTETIGQQMGMEIATIPKQYDEQKTRWAARLSDWIMALVVKPGNITYWFVFDGFREQPLLADTRDLIEELALRAESNVSQCRIVLLNYTEVLPIQINDYVRREQITPIGRAELCEFFDQVNADFKGAHTSADLTSKVDVLLAQVDEAIATNPEAGVERLRLLSRAVSETAKILFV